MGIKRSLDNDTEVHEVAEVQHEEVILLSVVILEPVEWETLEIGNGNGDGKF